MDKTFRESEEPLSVARIGGAEQLRNWRERKVECPVNDPKCIANHLESDYCIHESNSCGQIPVLEAPEGVGAAVIPRPTVLTVHKDLGASVGDTVEVANFEDKNLNGKFIVTSVEGDEVEMIQGTPAEYAKLWRKNWINLDLEITPRTAWTGRRVDRRDKLVKSFKTSLHFPRVSGCGHKFEELHQPRHRNCESCWNALFWNQNELAENLARNYSEQERIEYASGRISHPIIHQYGRKFLVEFLRFATLLARYEHFKNTVGTECATVEEEKHVHES